MSPSKRAKAFLTLLKERIAVLDGAMGTMLQRHRLREADFRGARFADWPRDIAGNNDLLTLTQPGAIEDIHFAYALSGADILETNTFSSTSIAQADYGMADLVYELNRDGARLARRAAIKQCRGTPGSRCPNCLTHIASPVSQASFLLAFVRSDQPTGQVSRSDRALWSRPRIWKFFCGELN